MKGKIIIFTAAAMAILLMPVIGKAQSIVVGDFRVDNAPVGDWAGSPSTQKLLNNTFVVTWVDLRSLDTNVLAKIYGFDGSELRSEFRLDDGAAGYSSGDSGSGGITIDSSGNFFCAFQWSNDYVNWYGRIRKFLPNGDPAGPSVDVSELGSLGSQVIQTSKGVSDRIIVTYGWAGGVYYRFFDNNLIPIVNSTKVNQVQMASETGLASDSTGNFIVAWLGTSRMYGRLYDQDGNPRGDEFPLESTASGGAEPRAAYNKDGNFIVVWFAGLTYSLGRVFDGDGNPLTSVFYLGPVLAEPNESYGQPSVDTDDAGNFIVTYEYSSDLTPKGIYGTILYSNGFVLNQFFPVSQPTSGLPAGLWMRTDVAYLSGGNFATAWQDGRNDSNGDIYANILKNDGWTPPAPVIPAAGPLALAILALGLSWILRRRIIA